MLNEIDKDFYCSVDFTDADCMLPYNCFTSESNGKYNKKCKNRHRKHPTPEQFKEEYGRDYHDDGAVYGRRTINNDKTKFADWIVMSFGDWQVTMNIAPKDVVFQTVCACTPFGKPDKDWRP